MREYTVTGENITIANAGVTLVCINPASGQTIEIVRCWVGQTGTATSAMYGIELNFKATAFPTLVSATPGKTKSSDPASQITGGTAGAAGTAGINASAEGAGATTLIYPDQFNNLVGWIWTPSMNWGESVQINSAAAKAFCMKLQAAPSSLSGWNFGVTYRELG